MSSCDERYQGTDNVVVNEHHGGVQATDQRRHWLMPVAPENEHHGELQARLPRRGVTCQPRASPS